MKMLLTVTFPHEPFNAAVRSGTIGNTIQRILEETKPESVYFTEQGGRRTALLVHEIEQASRVPALAEPWFLQFSADCQLRIAMTPQDLAAAGLDALGKKWA